MIRISILHASPWPAFNVGRVRLSITGFEHPVAAFKEERLDPLRWEREQLIKERTMPVRVPVLQELPEDQLRDTFVHIRGNYLSTGEQVEAAVPAALLSDS